MNLEDMFSEIDYKKLIKAVFDAALVDYTKLQSPRNRTKKYLDESFQNSVSMFFDQKFIFKHFIDTETQTNNLNFQELLGYFLNKNEINMQKIHKHISEESMSYWWERNFHDLKIPERITVKGVVWTIKNSPNNAYIDVENHRIYCPTKALNSDRVFFELCLKLMLDSCSIALNETEFKNLAKIFYLFLKINTPFEQKKP
jgi:uncharacterized ubiquitin-like protein YukD